MQKVELDHDELVILDELLTTLNKEVEDSKYITMDHKSNIYVLHLKLKHAHRSYHDVN